MQIQPDARLVRVLAIDRHDELAVDVLAELQRGGYRTLCECVAGMAATSDALMRRQWDLIVCSATGVDFELAQAEDVCRRMQPGTLFVVVGEQHVSSRKVPFVPAMAWLPASGLNRLIPLIAARKATRMPDVALGGLR